MYNKIIRTELFTWLKKKLIIMYVLLIYILYRVYWYVVICYEIINFHSFNWFTSTLAEIADRYNWFNATAEWIED